MWVILLGSVCQMFMTAMEYYCVVHCVGVSISDVDDTNGIILSGSFFWVSISSDVHDTNGIKLCGSFCWGHHIMLMAAMESYYVGHSFGSVYHYQMFMTTMESYFVGHSVGVSISDIHGTWIKESTVWFILLGLVYYMFTRHQWNSLVWCIL